MDLFAFLVYVFVTTFSPGPNNIMAMTNSIRYGFGYSFRYNFGVLVGLFFVMPMCVFLTAFLYEFIPKVKPIMTVVGSGYMLYLAYKVYKSSHKLELDNENKKATGFTAGVLVQFINAKLYIYMITTLSVFVLPYYSDAASLIYFIIFFAIVGFIGTVLWSIFGLGLYYAFSKYYRQINILIALSLVYCAASLFF